MRYGPARGAKKSSAPVSLFVFSRGKMSLFVLLISQVPLVFSCLYLGGFPMHRSCPLFRIPFLVRVVAVGLLAFPALWVCAQQQSPGGAPDMSPTPNKPVLVPAANHLPDANDRMEMDQQQSKKDKFEAANAARRKQISDDAAKLLELATELKSAVDKTDKDTLSIDVIRKADTIERLAKGVKEKMKLTVGAG
jgi:hypothetical protein